MSSIDKKKVCESLFEVSDDDGHGDIMCGVLLNLGALVDDPATRMYLATAAAWKKVVQTKTAAKRETRCDHFAKVVLRWVRYRFRQDFFVTIDIPDKKHSVNGMLVDLLPALLADSARSDDVSLQMACSKINLAMLRAGHSSKALRAARSKKLKREKETRRLAPPGTEQAVPGDEDEDVPSCPTSPVESPVESPAASPSVSPREGESRSSGGSGARPVPAAVAGLQKMGEGRGIVPSLSSYALDEISDRDSEDEGASSAPVSDNESDSNSLKPGSASSGGLSDRSHRVRSASMFSTMVVKTHGMVPRAQYLTLLEADLFRSITPAELSRMAWQKSGKEITSPNVLASLKFFNDLSFYVSHSVCSSSSEDARATMIKQHLQLAELCFGMGNFSTIMAVIGGLNNVSVQRLKKTWKQLGASSDKLWKRLNNLMDSKQNYAKYRAALLDFRTQKRPSVPFLGVFLRDITFIEDGNEDYLDEKRGKLNREKLRLLGQSMQELEWYQNQSSEYSFKTKSDAKQYWKQLIVTAPENKDELLYEMSLAVAPRKTPAPE